MFIIISSIKYNVQNPIIGTVLSTYTHTNTECLVVVVRTVFKTLR